MTPACLAFALGAALLQWQPVLPGAWALGLLPFSAALAFFKPRLALVFTFALGFLLAALPAHARMAEWPGAELEGRDVQVLGGGASLPATTERGQRFAFDVE